MYKYRSNIRAYSSIRLEADFGWQVKVVKAIVFLSFLDGLAAPRLELLLLDGDFALDVLVRMVGGCDGLRKEGMRGVELVWLDLVLVVVVSHAAII